MVHDADFFVCPVFSRAIGGCTIYTVLLLYGELCWIDGVEPVGARVDDQGIGALQIPKVGSPSVVLDGSSVELLVA